MRLIASVTLAFAFLANVATADLTGQLKGKLDESRQGAMAFAQTVEDPDGKVIESVGRLAYTRPSKFFLEYDAPDPVKVVSDGETLWVHDVGLNQVVVSDLSQSELGQGFLAVLSATDFLSEFDLGSHSDDNLDWLVLTPHDEEKASFTDCEIGFDKSGVIVAVKFTDLVGNKVHARFHDIEPVPDHGRFSYEPPDGAEVIFQPD